MRFSNVEPEGVVSWVAMPLDPIQDIDKYEVFKVLPLKIVAFFLSNYKLLNISSKINQFTE